jgi:hypothetical protein
MLKSGQETDLANQIAALVHQDKHVEAARQIYDYTGDRCPFGKFAKKEDAYPVLQTYLHDLLENDAPEYAAKLLWTTTQFTFEPESVKALWKLFDEADMGLVMGAAKMGKSFSLGARCMLEWIRDPEYTSIRVIGPSANHLEANLFSHLVSLNRRASLPLPGDIGALFIGLDRREQLSSIRGVIIPKGNVKKSGSLQGGHRRPRLKPHPVFGPLSRLIILIDEIENVPTGLWMDIDNVLSDIEEKGGQGFKLFGSYNPTDPKSEVAKRAEPPFGWQDLDPDVHYRWTSVRGWEVLRLDGEKSENVISGRIIFPGLQNRVGLEKIAKNAGGRQGAGYYMMGRGLYPHTGHDATVIPAGMWPKWRGEFIWWEDPQPVAGVDLALEGGDEAVYTLGQWGRASGVKWPASIEFPQGHTTMFKNREGQVLPRWGLQAVKQFVLPKGDTVAMKNSVLEMNRKAGVKPEFFSCDRTGVGRGTSDLIKYEWASNIHDINYSQAASDSKLMEEDTKNCKDEFERMFSELWFALRAWGEFGYLLLGPEIDFGKLTSQVIGRKFRTKTGKRVVESKSDFMSRGNSSPNDADSLTLLVYAARMGSALILSMRGADPRVPGDYQDWFGEDQYPGGSRIDESNRTQYLDTSDRLPMEMGENWIA